MTDVDTLPAPPLKRCAWLMPSGKQCPHYADYGSKQCGMHQRRDTHLDAVRLEESRGRIARYYPRQLKLGGTTK